MISAAIDYQPIDRRPLRWSSVMDPFSLQKVGLVHWIPCSKSDANNMVLVDRRYRTDRFEVAAPGWLQDQYRGQYGVINLGTTALFNFPRVTEAPITITFWTRHGPVWSTTGAEVFIGAFAGWHAYYVQTSANKFEAVHAENTVFEIAEVTTPITAGDWHFCAAVFVSNSERWAFCDGIASAHNTNPLTPTVAKDRMLIGNTNAGGSPSRAAIRDIRVYNRALSESELTEMYRNPYDLYAQLDRNDDFQFFTTSEPVEGISVPAQSVGITLHTPLIVQPKFIEPAVQTIATALHAPSFLADLGFQVSALTVSVTAHAPASLAPEEEVIVEDERTLEPHNFRVRIVDYVGGDDLRISRTYTELPEGIIISKGYLTIKRQATSNDADAILQKTITSAEGLPGQITDATTTGGSIELYFDLTGAETGTLTPLIPYNYDVQIISLAGAVYTCEKGVIVMQQGVTGATS